MSAVAERARTAAGTDQDDVPIRHVVVSNFDAELRRILPDAARD